MFLNVFYSSTPGFQLAKISTSRAFADSQPIATGRSGWPGLPFPLARRRVAWAPPMANCDIIWVPKKKLLQNCPSLFHIWSVISIFHHMSGCFLLPITIPIVPLEMSNSSPKMSRLPVVSQLYLQVETISSMDVFSLEVYVDIWRK